MNDDPRLTEILDDWRELTPWHQLVISVRIIRVMYTGEPLKIARAIIALIAERYGLAILAAMEFIIIMWLTLLH